MNRSLADLEGSIGSVPRMGALATLGGLVSQQPMLGALSALNPAFGLAANPVTPHALESARDIVTLPGRAMDQGVTTEEAVPWAADTAMNLAGLGAPMATVGSAGATGGKLATPQGIRAYHGSPHDFERFDISRIGSGEGAQAYGHGLYFAENEATAKAYQEALGGKFTNPRRNQELSAIAREMRQYEIPGRYHQYSDPRGYELAAQYDRLLEERAKDVGRMYEVNLRAGPEEFLDWDKSLAQQAPQVRDTLHRVGRNPNTAIDRVTDEMRGGHFYNALASRTAPRMDPLNVVGVDKATATESLREAGIPGIRYLDQGSRVGGSGTSNYVVFDDKIIDILKKYGVSSIAALPPAVQLMLGGQEQQGGN